MLSISKKKINKLYCFDSEKIAKHSIDPQMPDNLAFGSFEKRRDRIISKL